MTSFAFRYFGESGAYSAAKYAAQVANNYEDVKKMKVKKWVWKARGGCHEIFNENGIVQFVFRHADFGEVGAGAIASQICNNYDSQQVKRSPFVMEVDGDYSRCTIKTNGGELSVAAFWSNDVVPFSAIKDIAAKVCDQLNAKEF